MNDYIVVPFPPAGKSLLPCLMAVFYERPDRRLKIIDVLIFRYTWARSYRDSSVSFSKSNSTGTSDIKLPSIVLHRLGGDVVEVHYVAHSVQYREEERSASRYFVELDVGIQRYVLLDGELFQLRDEVPGHGEQENGVAEGDVVAAAALFARPQPERESVGLSEEVLQLLLSALFGFSLCQHYFAHHLKKWPVKAIVELWNFSYLSQEQALLVGVEKQLQLADELLLAANRFEFQHQVVIPLDGFLHYHRLDVFEVDHAKTLALSSDDVNDRLRAELDLDQSLVVGVQPLMDHHGLDGQFAVLRLQFLLFDLEASPAAILQLDHAVSSAGTHDGDKAQEDTGVDVHKLVAL
ncbi:hypothetical protein HUJ04_008666 [Dendroctonus ponderosae]|nr:hypothetical protein HUJ04_008666 [Dendroctonus ponderosae]